jgi:hypothetical protein
MTATQHPIPATPSPTAATPRSTLATRPPTLTAPRPGAGAPSGSRRRSLREFLRPYRGSLSLASGPILVQPLLDLARPWPLKLAVDNAIGGRPLGGPLAALDQLGPGWRRWPRWPGSGWSGWARWSATWSRT